MSVMQLTKAPNAEHHVVITLTALHMGKTPKTADKATRHLQGLFSITVIKESANALADT